ncbi:hypothetical protein YC2023_036524 [Brassica napus]
MVRVRVHFINQDYARPLVDEIDTKHVLNNRLYQPFVLSASTFRRRRRQIMIDFICLTGLKSKVYHGRAGHHHHHYKFLNRDSLNLIAHINGKHDAIMQELVTELNLGLSHMEG